MLDHSRSVIVVLSLVLKLGLDPIYSSFGDIVILIFRRFGLKLPIPAHFGRVWGIFHQHMVTHCSNPRRHFLAQKHVVGAIKRENQYSGSTWAQDRETRSLAIAKRP